MTNKSIKRSIRYAAILVGGLLVLSSFLIGSRIASVSRGVALEAGASNSLTFVADVSADYLIEIEVERNLPFDEINCMLGLGNALSHECESNLSRIDVGWEVRYRDTGTLLTEGSSAEEAGGAWSDTISRTVGRFAAKKGVEYNLLITSNSAETLPASLNPRMSVRPDPLVAKSHLLISRALLWIGLAILTMGLAVLVSSLRRTNGR